MAKRKETTKPATSATTELVPAEPETDLGFVQTVGAQVVAFLKSATEFFARADKLEKTAADVLAEAKQLKQPANGDEDAKLQHFIQRTNKGRKVIEEHWQPITSAVHKIHRRLTSRRDRGVELLNDAAQIGNKLHNAYTAEARRKAAEEQERLRRAEEERARQERERELQRLEAEALKREAVSKDLSERERLFVELVASGTVATAAAKAAGYREPDKQADRLLKAVKITKAIEAKREAAAVRQQAKAIAGAPLDVDDVPEVKPDIVKSGAHDVTRWKAEVVDAETFIAAAISGRHGIPVDVLTIDEVRLNQYARDLKLQLNRWPGVRAVFETKVV